MAKEVSLKNPRLKKLRKSRKTHFQAVCSRLRNPQLSQVARFPSSLRVKSCFGHDCSCPRARENSIWALDCPICLPKVGFSCFQICQIIHFLKKENFLIQTSRRGLFRGPQFLIIRHRTSWKSFSPSSPICITFLHFVTDFLLSHFLSLCEH